MQSKDGDDAEKAVPDNPESYELVSRDDSAAPKTDAAPATTTRSVTSLKDSAPLSIAAYCIAAIAMTLVNKFVVSGNAWNLNFFYIGVQHIIGVLVIVTGRFTGLLTDISPFDKTKAKRWFPISMLLVAMVYTGNRSLQYLSVPVYTIFKNLTTVIIALGERWMFSTSISRLALLSFVLIVLSSLLAAGADLSSAKSGLFEGMDEAEATQALIMGYFWMATNVMATAGYILGMRKMIKALDFKDWDTIFYNDLLSVPVLIPLSLLTEDWSSQNFAANFPPESRNQIFFGFAYSSVGAMLISYSTAWCIRVTSSTTYAMAGSLNKLPLAAAGLVFFAAPITVGSISAILLGFASGALYTYSKTRG